MSPMPTRQCGMVMLVALIMLVLMLLMAVASFNMGRHNTLIAGNMQQKMQTTSAANLALEAVISSTNFIATPATPLPNNASTLGVDINSDGTNDITVKFDPPPCVKKVQVIRNSQLDVTNSADLTCTTGTLQTLGVEGSAGAADVSLCSDTLWEITARAEDAVTESVSTVVGGFRVRTSSDDALDPSKACPP